VEATLDVIVSRKLAWKIGNCACFKIILHSLIETEEGIQ
jgi:hypothetical protein